MNHSDVRNESYVKNDCDVRNESEEVLNKQGLILSSFVA